MIKQRIIGDSCKLFIRFGIKTTMDEIAKHSGVSKRTIYENFKDKNELLIECTEYLFECGYQQATAIFERADNVLDAVLQLLYRQNNRGRMNLKYMIELGKYYPEICKNHMLKYHEKKQTGLEELIKKGIEEGLFRQDVNPVLTAFMFSEQANIIFSEQFLRYNAELGILEDFSDVDVFDNMIITYLRGMSTSKGMKLLDEYLLKNNKSL